MSDRVRPGQSELFPLDPKARAAGSIEGLEVHVERPCRRCRSTVMIVAKGDSAALECANCGRFQQWLARECCAFLVEIVACFGRPTAPVRVFEQVRRPTPSIVPELRRSGGKGVRRVSP